MSWDQLEATLRRQAHQADQGDVRTAPADGSPPANCPRCFTRVRYNALGDGACPFGHFRWPDGG